MAFPSFFFFFLREVLLVDIDIIPDGASLF